MFEVILAGIIVGLIGYPLVTILDKWKKEEEQER